MITHYKELIGLFIMCTTIFCFGLWKIYKMSYNTTTCYTQKTYKTTSNFLNFKSESQYLAKNNAVYLTQYKEGGYTAYLKHIALGMQNYFSDPVNFFCLIVAIGQVYDYFDFRSVIPLVIFSTLFTLNHLYTVSSLLTLQNKINNKKITKMNFKFEKKEIKQSELKRGDLVELKYGDEIPADILLLSNCVSVQELELTGENIVVSKMGLDIGDFDIESKLTINHFANNGFFESKKFSCEYTQKNIIFRGTTIVDTNDIPIIGFVIETGNDCQIYRIDANISKQKTKIQLMISKLCLINLYLLLLLASLFGVIIYSRSGVYTYKHLWSAIRKTILLLNVMVPLSLQFFFNTASVILSRRIEETNKIKITRNGVTVFQTIPKYIVSDKTGTITTNTLKVSSILTLNKTTLDQILINAISCSDIQVHSKTGQLLKNDVVEEQLLSHLCKETRTQIIKNNVVGEIVLMKNNEQHVLKRVYYQPFNYEIEVKLAVLSVEDKMILHVQGTPEAIQKYTNNDKLRIDDKPCPINVYKRVIGHASKIITVDEFEILKKNPAKILVNMTDASMYTFFDYVVDGIDKSIKTILDSGKDFTMLTGDRCQTAIEIGQTIGIIGNYLVIDTIDDVSSALINPTGTQENICYVINGKLLQLIESNNITKLKALINNSNKRIIYRASPNNKQLFVSFIQSHFSGEVMMIGDGSNDIAALLQSNIGVCVENDSNVNVQNVSDVIITNWNKIPHMLTDFMNKQKLINVTNNIVLMKHMTTAFILISMLLLSRFEKIKDPASPYLMNLMNATIFVCMYVFCKFEELSTIPLDRFILKGIVVGIFNGLMVFTHVNVNDGIKMLVCQQVIQLLYKFYTVSIKKRTRLTYTILGIVWFCGTLLTTLYPYRFLIVIIVTNMILLKHI